MPPPRASLLSFLTTARKALAAPRPSHPLTLVVGNESADLDSLCSAVLLAYFRTHAPPHYRLHIPIANLRRADLALRPELGAVLRRAGVEPADLPTLSDLPPPPAEAAAAAGGGGDELRLLLVDHNVLTGELDRRGLAQRVVGCVDHHEDEGVVPSSSDGRGGLEGAPRVVRKCGSCASLVVEHARALWADEKDDGDWWTPELAYIALGPILMDTTNLTSRDKTTPTDVWAVEAAEARIRAGSEKYERKEYFDELSKIKEDLSQLSMRDVFRKDYKSWTEGGLKLGTSSVAQGFEYLLDKAGGEDKFVKALRKWAQEEEMDVAAVLTTLHPNGQFTRELMVWAFGSRAVEVARAFVENNKDKLKLQTLGEGKLDDSGSGDKEWRMCWRQTSLENSRKQIAPMLREAMRNLK